ncbi:CbrC family protein [Shewanella sp.]|uniref:CbrC family protein n=1 Tax=Shewanella sp. TaxID=50422 RepID=UPI0026239ECC|nr:CbrC family protein [Shewanella sp.]
MIFPKFKYHPDPIKTGSIVESKNSCDCCKHQQGYVYSGSIYSKNRPDSICPWCIADGGAAKMFGIEFVSLMPAIIDPSNPQEIECSERAFDELLHRTPGFSSYQEIEWPNHCGDFCEYHGISTVKDIKNISAEQKERLFQTSYLDEREHTDIQRGKDDDELHYFLRFSCRNCGESLFQFDPD